MNIVDDQLVFDLDSDILRFTPLVQRALAYYSGEGVPAETYVLKAFNDAIATAVAGFKENSSDTQNLGALGAAIAIAEDPLKAQAQALIDQAKALLDVQGPEAAPAAMLNPAAENPVLK